MRASIVVTFVLLAVLSFAAKAELDPLVEYRFCTIEPVRDSRGHIFRRRDVLVAFQNIHPCPATGLRTGPCKNWYMDHVIPLANGGCDAVFNLQWLPGEIKTCAGTKCKDRFERKIYKQTVN